VTLLYSGGVWSLLNANRDLVDVFEGDLSEACVCGLVEDLYGVVPEVERIE